MKKIWKSDEWITNGSKLIATDLVKAKCWIKKGIKEWPNESVGWFNLGLALHQDKRIDEAIRSYRQALKCPNAPTLEIRNNLAQDLLLNQEYEEGWQLYEYRYQRMQDTFQIYEKLHGLPWNGFQDDRKCEHLIVIAEQGYGDTIQFCRLVLELEKHGINASLFCQEALAKLLRSSTEITKIRVSLSPDANQNIRWCPLMSLPKHLEINKMNIPLSRGYIKISQEIIGSWKERLMRKKGKKLIALHWQGNPKFEQKLYSRGRSMNASNLNLLQNIEGLEFISLQKGEARNGRNLLKNLNFVEGQDEFEQSMNFIDTAAVLANCDLLISTDSSVVHLAGAMNIQTWVALSWVPEWRWGLNSYESPWYDSVRLFRQEEPGNWTKVIKQIDKELLKIMH